MPLILEGIVTTRNPDGSCNVAPMGPIAHVLPDRSLKSLTFRPFPDSTTGKNLLARREGVFHITDQTLLFAQAVTGLRNELANELLPAAIVDVDRLKTCCRWYEFRVTDVDDSGQRFVLETEIVHTQNAVEWLGFNRAQAAVIEAAILATRLHLIARDEIEQQMHRLQVIVEKTAAPADQEAFELIARFIEQQDSQTAGRESNAAQALSETKDLR